MKKLMKMVLSAWCLVLGAEAARAAELPASYTAVDYIVAPRDSYIDTGYKPNQDTRVVMDVTVQGVREYWFGCWDEDYNKGAFAFGNDGTGIYAGYGNQGGTFGSVIANGRHSVELDKNVVKVDGGATFKWAYDEDFGREGSLANSLFLFAQNRKGTAKPGDGQGDIICHGCTISEGSVVKRDFVPCVREGDLAIGLYDLAENDPGKAFYSNAGSGKFGVPEGTFCTVTVGEHSGMNAAWTSGGGSVTNAIEGTSFELFKGTADVRVVFTARPCYSLDGNPVVDLGTVEDDITFDGNDGRTMPSAVLTEGDVAYLDWNAEQRKMVRATVPAGGYVRVTGETRTFENGKWYVVSDDVVVDGSVTVEGEGAARLILGDGCSLKVTSGIFVRADKSFAVYGQAAGTGRLTAMGRSNCAGIGGENINGWAGAYGDSGSITINGGIVTATGGNYGAGIGGGRDGDSGAITINGGTVTANGGESSPGIGGGHSRTDGRGKNGLVRIDGGEIDVRAGRLFPFDVIGHGNYNVSTTSGPIEITGGIFAFSIPTNWIHTNSVVFENSDPETASAYPWRVVSRSVQVPVDFVKGEGVTGISFLCDDGESFEPFPNGGTVLAAGTRIRIRVRTERGYRYVGETEFRLSESAFCKEIRATEIDTEGQGGPECPWLVGDSIFAWTNGVGGLTITGEGPMDDFIGVNGAPWEGLAADIAELTVTGGVTRIGDAAFAGLTELRKATVASDSLASIGAFAFADCWSLAELTLPDGLKAIDESAFEYCFELESCVLPATLEWIGERAFLYCWTLTEVDVPDSVVVIDDQAFAGCSWIERLRLGSGLLWVGESAFSDCTSIESIEIRAEEPPYVGEKAFYLVPASAKLAVPAASIGAYEASADWSRFEVEPASPGTSSDVTDRSVVARPVLAARLASTEIAPLSDGTPAFEVVPEEDGVRVTVRLPKALPGILYRLLGSADVTFANSVEIARGSTEGSDGLELSGIDPAGTCRFFKVTTEAGGVK